MLTEGLIYLHQYIPSLENRDICNLPHHDNKYLIALSWITGIHWHSSPVCKIVFVYTLKVKTQYLTIQSFWCEVWNIPFHMYLSKSLHKTLPKCLCLWSNHSATHFIGYIIIFVWCIDLMLGSCCAVNSLAPGKSGCDSKNGIFNLVLLIGIFRSFHNNALRWMSEDLNDDKSTLVQVMAWGNQATSHCLSQCWLSSLLPYGVARPQWVINKANLRDLKAATGL